LGVFVGITVPTVCEAKEKQNKTPKSERDRGLHPEAQPEGHGSTQMDELDMGDERNLILYMFTNVVYIPENEVNNLTPMQMRS
jgi:hypothetical protein